jgi:predicted transcriptional regulator
LVEPEKPRSTVKIYLDVLTVAAEEGSAKPTRILQKANLSHDRLVRHVGELTKKGLLEEVKDGDSRYYVITLKGKEFVKEMKKAQAFLSAFGVSM